MKETGGRGQGRNGDKGRTGGGRQEERGQKGGGEGEGKGRENLAPTVISKSRRLWCEQPSPLTLKIQYKASPGNGPILQTHTTSHIFPTDAQV